MKFLFALTLLVVAIFGTSTVDLEKRAKQYVKAMEKDKEESLQFYYEFLKVLECEEENKEECQEVKAGFEELIDEMINKHIPEVHDVVAAFEEIEKLQKESQPVVEELVKMFNENSEENAANEEAGKALGEKLLRNAEEIEKIVMTQINGMPVKKYDEMVKKEKVEAEKMMKNLAKLEEEFKAFMESAEGQKLKAEAEKEAKKAAEEAKKIEEFMKSEEGQEQIKEIVEAFMKLIQPQAMEEESDDELQAEEREQYVAGSKYESGPGASSRLMEGNKEYQFDGLSQEETMSGTD